MSGKQWAKRSLSHAQVLSFEAARRKGYINSLRHGPPCHIFIAKYPCLNSSPAISPELAALSLPALLQRLADVPQSVRDRPFAPQSIRSSLCDERCHLTNVTIWSPSVG